MEETPSSEIGVREIACADPSNNPARFLRLLGPGIVTGASDDDPSGIATYSVAGAALGFSTLWTPLLTLPMMAAVQYISAKIGLVTGQGLARILRQHYPRPLVITLALALALVNTINAGADIGAIGASVNLLFPHISINALVLPIAAILLVLQVWGSYRTISSVFKWLTMTLFAYIGASFFAHPHWSDVLRGTFAPKIVFNTEYMTTLVAILGTTISPYMIFWQANQEVEENIALGRRFLRLRRGATSTELRYAAIDVNCGMFFSNLVMYFIILATASTLFVSGHHHITTATDAAKALVPLAGARAEWLLAAGMIGSGILAVPILTMSVAYAVAEAFGWKEGVSLTAAQAPRFYAIIAASTIIGACLTFIGFGTIAALYWSAVINGVLAPVLLVAVMLVANNKRIMGKETNGPLLNALGWITVGVMGIAALGLAIPLFAR